MKVLKIGAIWCSGCIVMGPRWQEIEADHPDLQTQYFEFDDHPDVMEKYGITDTTLPVFIWLDKQGQELHREHGEISKDELLKINEKYQDQ